VETNSTGGQGSRRAEAPSDDDDNVSDFTGVFGRSRSETSHYRQTDRQTDRHTELSPDHYPFHKAFRMPPATNTNKSR
jgi:hypothetical protein